MTIDLADVCIALSGEGGALRWYFDVQTGSTLLLNGEYDPAENGGLSAEQVERDARRFKRIPTGETSQTLDDMLAFARQTTDLTLKGSLELALEAPHPERRFRAVLGWLPDEQARWHSFRQAQLETRARAWLKTLGL